MKRNLKKRLFYILLSCVLVFSNSATVLATTTGSSETTSSSEESSNNKSSKKSWAKGPSIGAKSAILMDASTGVILYEKNSKEAQYPASITKILTTLLAIENSSLSETVTFSHDSVFNVARDSSLVGIDVGEKLSLEDCLYAILLNSANEVSYAVAEHVGGTYENFVKMMNDKAKELGCVNSHFNNPHGLPDEKHYTCAYDMALIAREAIKNTTFAKVTGTRTYTLGPTNLQKDTRPLANHHKLVLYPDRYPGVIGGKTGWTTKSGYTLVTFAEKNGMTLISVVMACATADSQYTDTTALLDYGFNNFTLYNLSSSAGNEVLEDSPFFTKYSNLLSSSDSLLSTGSDGYVVLPNSAKLEDAKRNVTLSPLTKLEKGDNVIGNVSYTYEDRIVGSTDIIYHNTDSTSLPAVSIKELSSKANYSSNPGTISSPKKHSLQTIFIILGVILLVVLVLLYYLLVIRQRAKRRRYYRHRMNRHKNRHNRF